VLNANVKYLVLYRNRALGRLQQRIFLRKRYHLNYAIVAKKFHFID